MADGREVVSNAVRYLADNDVDIATFISIAGMDRASVMQMRDEDQAEFCCLFDRIDKSVQDRVLKGKYLEELSDILFNKGGSGLLQTRRNLHTSTNEIDLLVSWTEAANAVGANREFRDLGNSFLCECKNYNKKVDVTYVGKFCSLLTAAGQKFGVMVAWKGVTGEGWNDASGLIKKFALGEKRYVVVIDRNDLKRIYDKKDNLYALLNEKYLALKNDISYEKLITSHELESGFRVGTK